MIKFWEKPNFSNPSSNRYHQIFDYMFIFSKGKLNVFNAIKDVKTKYTKPFGKNTFRDKDGTMKERETKDYGEYGMRRNVWLMNTSGQENPCKAMKHPATFPEKLAHDHILSWSKEGDKVFDPLMGSNTVGKMCKQLNREFVGIEKDSEYFKLSQERIL